MKPSDFFALMGVMYLAPHTNKFLGLGFGFVLCLVGVVLLFIERDDL